ncbi:MAG: heavy metal sensor histidine kinase [Candidatus Kryptoniota bacterium]
MKRNISIKAKLTILFSFFSFLILTISALILNWTLSANLGREDTDFLIGKIHVLRSILSRHPTDKNMLEEEVKWEAGPLEFTRYYARIINENDSVLIERSEMQKLLPPSVFPKPVPYNSVANPALIWKSPDGKTFEMFSAYAKVGGGLAKIYTIQVALDISYEKRLLRNFRSELFVILFLGVLLSGAAGYYTARKGLEPLQRMTASVTRISANRLSDRIQNKHFPGELKTLAASFNEMLERLEESFERLSRFSADIAHELRTPINNLMGETEVALSKTRTADEYREVLESNLEEFGRLSKMIDNLLFIARAENAREVITKSSLDIEWEVKTIFDFYEALAEESRVQLSFKGGGSVFADSLLFRQALSNLISNAIRHVQSGGLIEVGTSTNNKWVEVYVKDNGTGIPKQDLERVFDRFYRGEHSKKVEKPGMGLGLSIVKSIMQLHGGTVSIKSETGKGTTVTLSFPAQGLIT